MSAGTNSVLADKSNFSKTIDFAARMVKARKKIIRSTLAAAGGGAGHNGPPRLVVDHLEARDLIARDIRKDKSATTNPIAYLFCGSEVQVCTDSNDGATDSRLWAGCQAYTDNPFDWYVFFVYSRSLAPS